MPKLYPNTNSIPMTSTSYKQKKKTIKETQAQPYINGYHYHPNPGLREWHGFWFIPFEITTSFQ
jgi:hypothetical protein